MILAAYTGGWLCTIELLSTVGLEGIRSALKHSLLKTLLALYTTLVVKLKYFKLQVCLYIRLNAELFFALMYLQ